MLQIESHIVCYSSMLHSLSWVTTTWNERVKNRGERKKCIVQRAWNDNKRAECVSMNAMPITEWRENRIEQYAVKYDRLVFALSLSFFLGVCVWMEWCVYIFPFKWHWPQNTQQFEKVNVCEQNGEDQGEAWKEAKKRHESNTAPFLYVYDITDWHIAFDLLFMLSERLSIFITKRLRAICSTTHSIYRCIGSYWWMYQPAAVTCTLHI